MSPPSSVLGQYADEIRRLDWELIPSGFSRATVWKGSGEGTPHFVLKSWPVTCEVERLAFIHRAQSHASILPFVPRLVETRSGTTSPFVDGICWDLSTWMQGEPERDGPFSDIRRRAAVAALRAIHENWAESSRGEAVCPAVERRLALINNYRTCRRGSPAVPGDPLLASVATRLPDALDAVERALNIWSRQRVPVQLCFTDIHRDHNLFTGDAITGIIDYGAVKIDSPAVDLARLFGEDEATLSNAVREYGVERLPAGLTEALAATAPACNLAAWTLRLVRDGDGSTITPAIRRRISVWADRLH